MKKLFLMLTFAFTTALCFSSEVGDFLKKAYSAYNSGDIANAITYVDSARKLLDAENLQNSDDEYIEVTNWDLIDLKSDLYIGKKIKFTGTYWGLLGKDKINIDLRGCTFENSLIDKILTLEKMKEYSFYGVLQAPAYKSGNPYLHVEAIE